LYYLEIDDHGTASVMAIAVSGKDDRFGFGAPRKLFSVPVWMGPPTPRNHYAVTSDGRRFLVDVLLESPKSPPLSVVVDWQALLRPVAPVERVSSMQPAR
jgi:hypothetical protein